MITRLVLVLKIYYNSVSGAYQKKASLFNNKTLKSNIYDKHKLIIFLT